MAGFAFEVAEFNTIVTMLGCLCATVQGATGYYAGYRKKKVSLIKTNDILFRSHRAFGGFATTLYFLGLFAGVTGYLGTIFFGEPPFEILSFSFNFHFWPSFAIVVIVILKTYLSYFNKPLIYKTCNWLGVATFIAWSYNWISSAVSYYLRSLPSNPQHPPPTYLLPFGLMWLQLILPFIIGAIIGYIILRKAEKREK
ncbi:MAG: hypothetical protein ACTSQW_02000 [Promethearchaeota archaeon]